MTRLQNMTAPRTSEPLVSVVTPVYNEAGYLAECIESVLNQSYKNWEHIIVNNCSTDRSLDIASAYAQKDPRIRVLNNETFLSQAQNNNFALQQISEQSKYVKMVLGDDWIFPECITAMVELAERHPTIGVVSSYRLHGTRVINDGLPYPSHLVSGRDICRLQLLDDNVFVFGSQTSILIRADIVRKRVPFYKEAGLLFDAEAIFEVMQNCDFGFVHQVLSFTRTENNSVSSRIRNFNHKVLDEFVLVSEYGKLCLHPEEYDKLRREVERDYYRFLGESVRKHWRDREFWNYHVKGIEAAGLRVDWMSVTWFAFLWFLGSILNIGKVSGWFSRALRRRSE